MKTPIEVLDDLGTSIGQITDYMFTEGIRGEPGSVRQCPVAVLLSQRFPQSQWLVSRECVWSDVYGELTLPLVVSAWIDEFDNGSFVELALEPDDLDVLDQMLDG